ncbi:MAG: hypothetical protein PHT75_01410 [Bacilli bacterium]|nr:hypothetical protein [Bacilli bacterium]MDD3304773.1 hypothetical protein [Bacilli bacterium]MDD4053795.1 hypothetical protein [Bacilli bacterium]MDD4411631.1 hypothetical protein [Bacilli bacterium]
MFKTMSEEQYLETVAFAKKVYREEVIRNRDVTAPSFTFDIRRGLADYAYRKKEGLLKTDVEKTFFKLNLIITNNDLFSQSILNSCDKYINQQDIRRIIFSFNLRKKILVSDWNNIINNISQSYYISPTIATQKITEILSFPNLYYKELETNAKGHTKSLSKK